jgi:hypothetical protein
MFLCFSNAFGLARNRLTTTTRNPTGIDMNEGIPRFMIDSQKGKRAKSMLFAQACWWSRFADHADEDNHGK